MTECTWVVSDHLHEGRTICYESAVPGSLFCYRHKCQTCHGVRAFKSKFCTQCFCPVVGCAIKAWACALRCLCCGKYHKSDNKSTCDSCVCSICGSEPVQRYMGWGDVLLCVDHNTCIVVDCKCACDIDNPRYCPAHKHMICQQLKTLELCLLRLKQPREIRRMFCLRFQWARENQLVCRICKNFYVSRNFKTCDKCTEIRDNGIRDIGLELREISKKL